MSTVAVLLIVCVSVWQCFQNQIRIPSTPVSEFVGMVEDWVGWGGKTDRKMEAGQQWATMSGFGEYYCFVLDQRPFHHFSQHSPDHGTRQQLHRMWHFSKNQICLHLLRHFWWGAPCFFRWIFTPRGVCIQKYHQSTFDTGGVRRVHSELGVQHEQRK